MTHEPNNPNCICDSCCERRAREIENEKAGYDAASQVTNYLNGRNARYVVMGMARQHRTLQQAFTRLCIEWLEHLAGLADKGQPGYFDLRNQASVEFAKKITSTETWQEEAKFLPYI